MNSSPEKYTETGLAEVHDDINIVRLYRGSIPTDSDGRMIILPSGKTDITGAWGMGKIIAEHGPLSWNARTPGREKFIITRDDVGKKTSRLTRHRPEVISVNSDTGLKTWRWVINESWVHPDARRDAQRRPSQKPLPRELRQIVYIVRAIPGTNHTGELIDNYVSEEDALLPPSEYLSFLKRCQITLRQLMTTPLLTPFTKGPE